MRRLRVVTLNTWKNDGDYPARLTRIADGLAALDPDVVCLQECFAGGGHDTARVLSDALNLQLYAAPARAKVRELKGAAVDSTSGLAILTRLPGRAETLGLISHPTDGERIAQRFTTFRLRILNLHLSHLRGGAGAVLRRRQLDEALDWARRDRSGSLLVCGDLNAGRGDPELAPLRAAAGDELGSTLHAAGEGCAIDHAILLDPGDLDVSRRVRALATPDSDGRYPSDHAAVVVDLNSGS
ncbi:endonuclease/exonuclease/phosphatase family protein [Phenylobacterium sp.]|uniref:endonuclease/exonuclease/phosphatase family protein n=1 Tax=Phenylobacterium sp. TaxID=1871053 RepID=UPI003BA9AD76